MSDAGERDDSTLARLEVALEAAGMGTWDWEVATGEVRWSDGLVRLYGLEGNEEFGRTFEAYAALLHPEDRARVLDTIQAAVENGPDEYAIEHRIIWPDGSLHWIEGKGRVYRDSSGKAIRMAGTAFEFTRRKTAEEEVQRVERLFRAIVDDQSDMIVRWKPDFTRTFVNQAYCRAFGASYDELVGTSFLPLVAEPFRSRLVATIAALTPSAPIATDLHQGVMPDGSLRWQEWSNRGIFDSAGRLIELQSVGRDVTDRIEGEVALRRANRALRTLGYCNQALLRATTDLELYTEMCGAIVEHGQYRLAWIGTVNDDEKRTVTVVARAGGPDDFLNRPVHWGDDELGHGPTGTAIRTGQPFVIHDSATDPHVAPWRDQALRLGFLSAVALPIRLNGRVFASLTVYASDPGAFDDEAKQLFVELAEDIAFGIETIRTRAEHRRAEQSRDESEARLRQLAENINEVVWLRDAIEDRVLYVNPAYETIWGRSCESLYASPRSFLEGVHPDDRARVTSAIDLEVQGDHESEYRIVRGDGSTRTVHARTFAIRDERGRVCRVAGVTEDITDRRRIEEQFRQSQKMEAVGQLAGGIAHDFNNILLAIMLEAESAASSASVPPATRQALEQINGAATRAANLTKQLLQFSRKQIMQPGKVDLNEVVMGVAKMLQRVVREDVDLQIRLSPSALFTHADEGMLQQVLMNLAVNARDAMPNGGALRIETSAETLAEMDARELDLVAGPYVSFSIGDKGTGIAPENVPRIFEPFFTTKEPGKGTGLGLATAFGIVRQHGGTIRVRSQLNDGTTFQILLPANDSETTPRPSIGRRTAMRGGTETIMVVEDDEGVRRLTRRLLERHGYAVVESPNGVDAMKVWEAHGGRIHLLVTDLVMPEGMNGRELAARLRSRDRDLRVLLTSGYSPELAGHELTLEKGQSFLRKPFGPSDLLEAVRSSLES